MCNEGLEEEFFERLDSLATDVNFNSYHYQLMRFYKKLKRKDFDENFLWKEIEKRKVFSLI